MTTDRLRFLHLSDIHFKKLNFDIDDDIRDQLVLAAKGLKDNKGAITGVLICGDIAFSGKLDEYKLAVDWLEKLCNQVDCASSNVWSVPGNHDVDRAVIEGSKALRIMHQDLRSQKPEDVDGKLEEYFADSVYREVMYKSIQNYIHGFASAFECELSMDRQYVEHNLMLNDGSIEPVA